MNTINQDAIEAIQVIKNTDDKEFNLILDELVAIQEIEHESFDNKNVLPCKACSRDSVFIRVGKKLKYNIGCPECMNPKPK